MTSGNAEELADIALPKCHLVVSLLKRWILGTLQGNVGKKHLQDYLNEFTFRFNRRNSKSRGLLFYRLAQLAVVTALNPGPKSSNHKMLWLVESTAYPVKLFTNVDCSF